MKDRAVVETFIGVADKVGDRDGSALGVQTHNEVAERGGDFRDRLVLGCGNGGAARNNGGQSRREGQTEAIGNFHDVYLPIKALEHVRT